MVATAHFADPWHGGTSGLGRDDPVPRPATDRSSAVPSGARTMRSWPLLVLAAPAAAEVWSGWVGIAQKTGFGLVSPLPGILPSLHLDTSITLPVGVEAYAAYALRAWLAGESRQCRQPQPVARLVADPANLAAQDRVLVQENQKLCILGHLPPGQHHQTIQQAAYEQVNDRNDHSAMIPARSSTQAQSINRAPQDHWT